MRVAHGGSLRTRLVADVLEGDGSTHTITRNVRLRG
jgi:hypothetical protein